MNNTSNTNSNNKQVFLYCTKSQGEDLKIEFTDMNGMDKVLLTLNYTDLPGLPGPNHDG
jgi:hypothetical protein